MITATNIAQNQLKLNCGIIILSRLTKISQEYGRDVIRSKLVEKCG